MQKYNPGDIAPKTGSYKVVDNNGKKMSSVYVDEGNRLPPTQSSEYYYIFEE